LFVRNFFSLENEINQSTMNMKFSKIDMFIHKYGHVSSIVDGWNCIGGVIVRVFALSVLDRGFEPWSSKTKNL